MHYFQARFILTERVIHRFSSRLYTAARHPAVPATLLSVLYIIWFYSCTGQSYLALCLSSAAPFFTFADYLVRPSYIFFFDYLSYFIRIICP
jgi:hypothetical protein